jgi:Bacterial TSP3 repeat/Clostridial binary toxin B/anthrax toxin PA Ca-binding domain
MSKRWLAPILVVVWVAGPTTAFAARDEDRDRLPDRWERRHGLSTTKRSAMGNPDRDGLANRREYRLRTHPRRRDTDRDRLRDGIEVMRYRTNPRRRDTDRDGLSDRAEIRRYRTKPRKRDTDGDGYADGAEVRAGSDPRDASSRPGTSGNQEGPHPATPPPPSGSPPGPTDVGVPAGWTPVQSRSTSLTITAPGAVVQDVLFTNGADLHIDAPNVTIRRVKLEGGWIENDGPGGCKNGMLLEDVTITRGNGESGEGQEGVVSFGGYTARRVAILDRSEGFRSGGRAFGCGTATIENSFIRIRPPAGCGDWHGDGIQGYDSSGLVVRNVTIDFYETGCGGTAPFFYNGGSGGSPNGHADIDGLLVRGGSYSFRMGTPGSVRNLRIANNGWRSYPILIADAGCSAINPWDAQIVDVDANLNVTSVVRSQPCRNG